MSKHVLLTGALGLLGRATIAELRAQQHRVRAFDLDTPKNRKLAKAFVGEVEMVWGDLRNVASITAALADIDAVIHNAAIIPPLSNQQPELAEAVNVGGTKNVIAALQASGRNLPLIFSSSVSVHGRHAANALPSKASDALVASDTYSGHKIECERVIRESGLPFVILRLGAMLDANNRDMSPDAFRQLFEVSLAAHLEYVAPQDAALAQVNALSAPAALG